MRIKSIPVRRTVHGYVRTLPIGEVVIRAEMELATDGPQVRHAVFPLPAGGTGVVERLDDEGVEWLASAGGPWLPGTYEGLHHAVHAALDAAAGIVDGEIVVHAIGGAS